MLRKTLRQQYASICGIFNVEIVSHILPIRPNDWPLFPQYGTDCSRDNTVPVQVSAPIKVAAARDHYGQSECHSIGSRDQISARLANIIGMATFKGHFLGIRQDFVISVG